jgi:predicted transcriptional regulator
MKMSEKSSTRDRVYVFVCKNPGLSTYDLSKKLGMTGGRVRHALSMLKKADLIEFKFERQNPRIRKLSFPVDFLKLLPRDLKKEIKGLADVF